MEQNPNLILNPTKIHNYSSIPQEYVEQYNAFKVPTEFEQLNNGENFIVPSSYNRKLTFFFLNLYLKEILESLKEAGFTERTQTYYTDFFVQAFLTQMAKDIKKEIKKKVSSVYVYNFWKFLSQKCTSGIIPPSIKEYMEQVTKDNSEKNKNLEKLWAEFDVASFKDPKRALQLYNIFNAENIDQLEANASIMEYARANLGKYKFDNQKELTYNVSKLSDNLHGVVKGTYNEEDYKKSLNATKNFQTRNMDTLFALCSNVVNIADPDLTKEQTSTNEKLYMDAKSFLPNNFVVNTPLRKQ